MCDTVLTPLNLTETESAIIRVLYETGPISASSVRYSLFDQGFKVGRLVSISCVRSALQSLTQKGVLSRSRGLSRGKPYFYHLCLGRAELGIRAMMPI